MLLLKVCLLLPAPTPPQQLSSRLGPCPLSGNQSVCIHIKLLMLGGGGGEDRKTCHITWSSAFVVKRLDISVFETHRPNTCECLSQDRSQDFSKQSHCCSVRVTQRYPPALPVPTIRRSNRNDWCNETKDLLNTN